MTLIGMFGTFSNGRDMSYWQMTHQEIRETDMIRQN